MLRSQSQDSLQARNFLSIEVGELHPETAGASSLALHPGRLTMAEAASYTTISCLLRRQLSMKSNSGLSRLQRQAAGGRWGAARGSARARGDLLQPAVFTYLSKADLETCLQLLEESEAKKPVLQSRQIIP